MAIGKALGILMLGLAAIPLAACSSSVQLSSKRMEGEVRGPVFAIRAPLPARGRGDEVALAERSRLSASTVSGESSCRGGHGSRGWFSPPSPAWRLLDQSWTHHTGSAMLHSMS